MTYVNIFKSAVNGFLRSLKRFPAAIAFSAATLVVLIIITEVQPSNDIYLQQILNRMAMTFGLGISLFLSLKLTYESEEGDKAYRLIILYAAGALALLLYYFFLLDQLDMVSITRYIALNLVLILAFLFIPYLPRKEGIEMHITRVITGFFTTFIFSIVIFLGLAAILFTIDRLLGVIIDSKYYYYSWLFILFIFAPLHFFSFIPLKGQRFSPESFPKLLKVLLLYIVMPLLTVYTIVLYIYFVRIIVTWQWPVGLVSNLVLWYSVIAAAVLFLITPLMHLSKWANIVLRWLPKVIIPILVMMFISMGIRIDAYGITEPRYFVMSLGIWVFGVMVYYSLGKKMVNIVLPAALSIIVLISAFGPISSYSVSMVSQNSRFEEILVKNNMIKGGKILSAPENTSLEDKNEIGRILDYFRYNHSLKDMNYLPENFKMEDMWKIFGFEYQNAGYGLSDQYFNLARDNSHAAVDISGYDFMFDVKNLYNNNGASDDTIMVKYDPGTFTINISTKGSSVYQRDLKLLAEPVAAKYGTVQEGNNIPQEEMTFAEENQRVKAKFIFSNISGSKNASTGDTVINGLDFYMLVKIK